MPLLSNRRTLLAKLEVTYGTDPIPTGAANAILCSNLNINPLNAQTAERNLIRGYLGSSEVLIAGKSVVVEVEVEMAGSGTAGTAPAYDALLKACGMAATIAAGVDVQYKPISAAYPSVTLYYNIDGVLHKITGARGNVELVMQAGQIPKLRFTFTGLYNGPIDSAVPTVVYTPFRTPVAVNNTNTTGFTFTGFAGVLESLNVNFNMQQQYINRPGTERVQTTDRRVSGTAVIEAPDTIAAKNFFADALASTLGSLSIVHGTVAGNRFGIDSATVDIADPTYSDSNGVHMLSIPFVLVPTTAGNDEVTLKVY